MQWLGCETVGSLRHRTMADLAEDAVRLRLENLLLILLAPEVSLLRRSQRTVDGCSQVQSADQVALIDDTATISTDSLTVFPY